MKENVIVEIIQSQNIRAGRESFYRLKNSKKLERKVDFSAVTWIISPHRNARSFFFSFKHLCVPDTVNMLGVEG